MRFFYAIVAALVWITLTAKIDVTLDDNTMYLALAIIMAGAMAGGD